MNDRLNQQNTGFEKAFVLIDYTRDFVATDGKLSVGEPGQAIEKTILEKIRSTVLEGQLIVVVNDLHRENDLRHPENRLFPPHNIEGTAGRKLFGQVEELVARLEKKCPTQVLRMDKQRYSAFFGTPLELILRQEKTMNLELAGVCTDICVLHTAIDAYNRGFNAVIDEDAVASFNQEAHRMALDHFEQVLGFQVKRRG